MSAGIRYDFSGRTAIITGGAHGIGKAVANDLVRFGARVYVWDRDSVRPEGVESLMVDVTESDSVAQARAHVEEQTGRIDILVNSAGYLGGYRPFERFSSSEWQ